MRPLINIVPLVLIVFGAAFSFANQIKNNCQEDEVVKELEQVSTDVLGTIPLLNNAVDACFNPTRPQYIQQTHDVLNQIELALSSDVNDLHLAMKRMRIDQNMKADEFAIQMTQASQKISQAIQPALKQASNLTKYGFTISDAKIKSGYKYPECNSETNSQPEKNWTQTYNNLRLLQLITARLMNAANCLHQ